MFEFRPDYIAIGGNRHPAAADWDTESGFVAFGADQNIALWQPLSATRHGVQHLLHGHTDSVNAVKFFARPGRHTFILSGSVDRSVRVWRLAGAHSKVVQVLQGSHKSSVNCLAVLPNQAIFASGAADATICMWLMNVDGDAIHAELLQVICPRPSFFPLSIVLLDISLQGDVFLAASGTRSTVEVYLCKHSEIFEHQASLPGHEGWVRSLAITWEGDPFESDILLASASQDKYVRLWRLSRLRSETNGPKNTMEELEDTLSNKKHTLSGYRTTFVLTFEALLLGHEDWVYSLRWKPTDCLPTLLSASADNSIAMWKPEVDSGIWVCTSRFGEISLQKGSTTATGSAGGFWTSLWSSNGGSVISLAGTGSWRLWTFDTDTSRWTVGTGISGHTKPIKGIAWSESGIYLLSTGSDQTTRLHAELASIHQRPWHEVGRPQIHGYDINCIASINEKRFISGADEKLLRVFDEPQPTAALLRDLCAIESEYEDDLPPSASLAVLGLSNKVDEGDDTGDSRMNQNQLPDGSPGQNGVKTTKRQQLPTEDELARRTLWPEREKLYGHGYEISAVAATNNGKIVATSCKASAPEHAVVRLYTTEDWREIKPPLSAHSLTVTALAFSPDDRYLLSVGRDRQWTAFERNETKSELYEIRFTNQKGHSRMIVDVCWAPLDFGRVFGTAGRDKSAKVWVIENGQVDCTMTMTAPAAVTTMNFTAFKGQLVVAYGTEQGEVLIAALDLGTCGVIGQVSTWQDALPWKTINRLRWRPYNQVASFPQLAVAIDDGALIVGTVRPEE